MVLAISQTVFADGFVFDDEIGAGVTSTTSDVVTSSTLPPVLCEWGADQLHYDGLRQEVGEYVYFFLDQRYWRMRPSTGEVWVQAWRNCYRGDELVSSGLEWRQVVSPDPEVLAEGVYDEVVRRIPAPVPQLDPPGPGFVQLGMWLAVVDPGPISVTAQVGGVWATTTASLVSTSFDMGDGTVVTCFGAGDPMPPSAAGSVEPSPECGHTYRHVNVGRPFPVVIVSTWRVWWVGSGGAGGELGSIDRPVAFDYRVLEIQTVGSG